MIVYPSGSSQGGDFTNHNWTGGVFFSGFGWDMMGWAVRLVGTIPSMGQRKSTKWLMDVNGQYWIEYIIMMVKSWIITDYFMDNINGYYII